MTTSIDMGALVAAVGDAIVSCDRTGAITLWNPAAERIFGFTAAEAIGQSLDIIIPERMRKRHWDGYYKTMETGVTRYGNDVLSVPAVDKAGRTLSISFTVAMLFSPDSHVSQIVAVMRDETERFHNDRAQRKRLQELEAQLRAVQAGAAAADVTGGQPSSAASADLAGEHAETAQPTGGCPVHRAG